MAAKPVRKLGSNKRISLPQGGGFFLEEHPIFLGQIWLSKWVGDTGICWLGKAEPDNGHYNVVMLIDGGLTFLGCYDKVEQAVRALWLHKERAGDGVRMVKEVYWNRVSHRFEMMEVLNG